MIPTIVMPGVYTLKVMDVRLREPRHTSGLDMYAVKFETPSSHELWDWFSDFPRAEWKWRTFEIDRFADLPNIIDRYYLAVVTVETFPQTGERDKLRNRISEYLAEIEF